MKISCLRKFMTTTIITILQIVFNHRKMIPKKAITYMPADGSLQDEIYTTSSMAQNVR